MKQLAPHTSSDTLAALTPGQIACVTNITYPAGAFSLSARLGDLGISKGAYLRCERRSLFGDPCAYRLIRSVNDVESNGTVIALRASDASCIDISLISPPQKSRKIQPVCRKAGSVWD